MDVVLGARQSPLSADIWTELRDCLEEHEVKAPDWQRVICGKVASSAARIPLFEQLLPREPYPRINGQQNIKRQHALRAQ